MTLTTTGSTDTSSCPPRIGVVDTHAAATQRQVRLALPLLSTVRSGALILKPVTAGKQVTTYSSARGLDVGA